MLRKQLIGAVLESIGHVQQQLPSSDLPSLEERVNALNQWLSSVGCAKNSLRAAIDPDYRSEEHTSELQSLMRISYAVFCLKKKNKHYNTENEKSHTQHTS